MRSLAQVAGLLIVACPVFAQQPSLAAHVQKELTAPKPQQDSLLRKDDATTKRRWYWQDDSITPSTATSSGAPTDWKASASSSNDFSPVSLSWTFSGKNRFLPTLDVVGFDVKAGPQPHNPDAYYGKVEPPKIWNRARNLLLGALR